MKKLFYLFTILFAVLFAACEGTEPPISNKVETGASENITQTSVTLKGAVNVDIATYNSIEFGIMYDSSLEEVNNRSAQMVKASVLQGKDFKVDVTGLTANTKYYYCAYLLLNGMQYEYGAVKEFTTLSSSNKEDAGTPDNPNNTPAQPSDPDQPNNPEDAGDVVGGTANGHAYVDLGLSVKWATCNVGANVPEEYGDYFAWGETQPKEVYDMSNYKWYNPSNETYTKYCIDSNFGNVDDKTVLDLEDDAAHVNWGGEWRMPTIEEQQELVDYCTWKWAIQKGVKGYMVTSNNNGNSIFLPAAGVRALSRLNEAESAGYFWSSCLLIHRSDMANFLMFFFEYGVPMAADDRYYGMSVRPVLP